MMFSLFSQGCYVVGGLNVGDSEGCLCGGERWSEVWVRTVYYAIDKKRVYDVRKGLRAIYERVENNVSHRPLTNSGHIYNGITPNFALGLIHLYILLMRTCA